MDDLTKLKDQVEYVLRNNPSTRNNDISLMLTIWQQFYGIIGDSIKLVRLHDLPSQDGIKRIRAMFQNDKKLYLPTIKEVAIRRGWREDEWRELLGYKVTQSELF